MPQIPNVTNPLLLAAQSQDPASGPSDPAGGPYGPDPSQAPSAPGGAPPMGAAPGSGMPSLDPNFIMQVMQPLAMQAELDRQNQEAMLMGQQQQLAEMTLQHVFALAAAQPSPMSDAALTQAS